MSIDLAKKHLIDLSKKAEVAVNTAGLNGQVAEVEASFDVSYSMKSRYLSGEVQEASDRLLGLAMKFDDNQELNVMAYDDSPYAIGGLNQENFYQYVDKNIKPLVRGGTLYSPMMKAIMANHGVYMDGTKPLEPIVKKKGLGRFFGKKEAAKPVSNTGGKTPFVNPIFVIVLTDGDNSYSDYEEAKRVLRESSNYGFFWKFVGIGNEDFVFLKELDDLPGRLIDNAHFFKVQNIATVSEDALYAKLLQEFPEWITEARRHNLIQ